MAVNLDVAARTTGYIGRCLAFVRACLFVGAKYATALSAWTHAEHQHPGDTDPPAGVPVFWSAAKLGPFAGAGHVALSLGHGLVRSTAWPRTGRIGTVSIADLTRAWGRTYLGWTEDLNGVRVYTPTAPAPTPTPTPALEEDWFDMATLADLKAIQPAEIVYFFKQGDVLSVYEAVLRERTYAHVPDEDLLKRRRNVLTAAGVRWILWPSPVEEPDAFGHEVSWSK